MDNDHTYKDLYEGNFFSDQEEWKLPDWILKQISEKTKNSRSIYNKILKTLDKYEKIGAENYKNLLVLDTRLLPDLGLGPKKEQEIKIAELEKMKSYLVYNNLIESDAREKMRTFLDKVIRHRKNKKFCKKLLSQHKSRGSKNFANSKLKSAEWVTSLCVELYDILNPFFNDQGHTFEFKVEEVKVKTVEAVVDILKNSLIFVKNLSVDSTRKRIREYKNNKIK